MKDKIDELVKQGMVFNFHNNCTHNQYGVYSKPSVELLAWIATIEDFIIQNFGENSSSYRLFKKFDDRRINGNEQQDFEKEHTRLIAALKSCYTTTPKQKEKPITHGDLIKLIFEKFHSVVIQLRKRYNSRDTLDVQDEYDVQDLLHCLLKIHFNDIRKEEWTPSYAGGSSRMDFLLKEEQLVIEVKMTRQGLTDKELGKQLIEDKAKYKAHPDCKRLICFTYDPEGRITNPKGIQNDLNQEGEDFVVDIIIKPDI
ncbi:MAG: hypothetical protein U0264_11780 [Candidatus Kapaibacterium sp.]